MPQSVMTSKGQITIPGAIRKKLNLKTGDRIDFIMSDTEVILMPHSKTVADVFGILSRKDRKAVTTREMDDSLARDLRRRWHEGD